MSTLIQQLEADIPRMEAKYGSDDQFVKDSKKQLRAMKETQGKSAQEVYRLQAVNFSSATDQNRPETEEDGMRAGALRLSKVRRQFQDITGRTHGLLPLPSDMQQTTASASSDKPSTSK